MSKIAWHTMEVDEVLKELKTDRNKGLTTKEAKKRFQWFGPNEFPCFYYLKASMPVISWPMIKVWISWVPS